MATAYDDKFVDGKALEQVTTGVYNKLKQKIDDKPNTTITKGKGVTVDKAGDNYTISIASASEGILINDSNIQLNVVNDLTTGGASRPLTAEQGKLLKSSLDSLNNDLYKIKYKDITANEDLNNLHTAGFFRKTSNSTTVRNVPENNNSAFILIIHSIQGNDTYCQQILYFYNEHKVYIRERVENNFNAWEKIITKTEITSISNTVTQINQTIENINRSITELRTTIHKYHPLPTDIKSMAVSRDENNSSPELTYSETKK